METRESREICEAVHNENAGRFFMGMGVDCILCEKKHCSYDQFAGEFRDGEMDRDYKICRSGGRIPEPVVVRGN